MACLFFALTPRFFRQNQGRQRQSTVRRLLSHQDCRLGTNFWRSFLSPLQIYPTFSRQKRRHLLRAHQKIGQKKSSGLAFYSFGVDAAMKRVTIRSKVLLAVQKLHLQRNLPITSRAIAAFAGIDYKQCVNALCALLESDRILRVGKKRRATWLPKSCEETIQSAPVELERTLNAICAASCLRRRTTGAESHREDHG